MNCLDDIQLGDYVDGTLDVARESVEAHLAACDRCRALVADFQTIRFAALAMEPAVPPPAVWPKLAARVEAETHRWWHFGGSGVWRPVAALGMAVVVTTGLTLLGSSLAPAAGPARLAGGTAPVPLVNVAVDAAEKDYVSAIAGLEQITTAQRDALDQGTADVLQVNLTRAVPFSRPSRRTTWPSTACSKRFGKNSRCCRMRWRSSTRCGRATAKAPPASSPG
jgi:hypothetical protein